MFRYNPSLSFLCFLLLLSTFIAGPLKAVTLSNGSEPIIEKDYTLAILSGTQVTAAQLNCFQEVRKGVDKLIAKAKGMSIELQHPVHIRVVYDTDFLCSDLWATYGIEPDDELLRELLAEMDSNMNCQTLRELSNKQIRQRNLYPALRTIPGPMHFKCFYPGGPGLDSLTVEQREKYSEFGKGYLKKLFTNLNQPFSDFETTMGGFYSLGDSQGINAKKIWSARWTTLSEEVENKCLLQKVAYWIFDHLCEQTIKEFVTENFTTIQRQRAITHHLEAIREVFSDYLLEGHPSFLVPFDSTFVHPYSEAAPLPEHETLEEYIEGSEWATNDWLYEEWYAVLVPARLFLIKFGDETSPETMGKLLLETLKRHIVHFFSVEVNQYERYERFFVDEGEYFQLCDYPSDILRTNLGFLRSMKEASTRVLNPNEQQVFNVLTEQVYAGANTTSGLE